jgi:hypothetical protein
MRSSIHVEAAAKGETTTFWVVDWTAAWIGNGKMLLIID